MIFVTEIINKSRANNPTIWPVDSSGGETTSNDALQLASKFDSQIIYAEKYKCRR